ncbi:MAG: succinate dehydrogenase iron-sulfur subunit [Nitrospirota bacterium]
MKFRVFRFDPENDCDPYFDEFDLPVEKGMTVLEGLYYILENLDSSLAFRSSCRCAICGSCSMYINGQFRLACRTLIANLETDMVSIRPLSNLPILKDLVVDMKPFFENYKLIEPYLIPKEQPPEKEYYQSLQNREKIDGSIDCLLCGICYGACPTVSLRKDYLGPAAITKTFRFITDSRDGAMEKRLAVVATEDGIYRCHTIFNCQKFCPKDIDPSDYISQLKRKVVWQLFK